MGRVDPKVDEAIQTLNMKDGPTRRRLLTGTGLVSATAAASALLAACTSSSSPKAGSTSSANSSTAAAAAAVGNFPKTPAWQFWFVNHVTTNPFFVPTIFGKNDAAALLGLPQPKWGGSETSAIAQMTSYIDTAIAAKADGIATTVINSSPSDTSFTTPVGAAMKAGIPVVSYNADGPLIKGVATPGTNRLAYVGQALYLSGQQMGKRIMTLAKPGEVVIFIQTPGTANIQPRSDGASSVLIPAGYTVTQQQTSNNNADVGPAEKSWLLGHGSKIVAALAVDGTSSEQLGPQLEGVGLAGKIPAGCFDMEPGTLAAVKAGQVDFTINQDPYLQGFLPVIYLYLFNLTGGLVLPPNTDTGLAFVDKTNVDSFLSTNTTYEGSNGANAATLVPRSGAISNSIATTST
jgi:simple sugar transport system substrate-binding protein